MRNKNLLSLKESKSFSKTVTIKETIYMSKIVSGLKMLCENNIIIPNITYVDGDFIINYLPTPIKNVMKTLKTIGFDNSSIEIYDGSVVVERTSVFNHILLLLYNNITINKTNVDQIRYNGNHQLISFTVIFDITKN